MKTYRYAIFSLVASFGWSESLSLSPDTRTIVQRIIELEKAGKPNPEQVIDEGTLLADLRPSVGSVEAQVRRKAIDTIQKRRLDRQVGDSAAGAGTTSLVARPGLSDLFQTAFESGSLGKESQGTVTTFRGNAYSLYSLFDTKGCWQDPVCEQKAMALRGLSFSLSIDNKKPQETVSAEVKATDGGPVTRLLGLTGNGGRLTAFGVQYVLLVRHVPTSEPELKKWREAAALAKPNAAVLGPKIQAVLDKIPAATLNEALKRIHDGFRRELAKGVVNLQQRLTEIYLVELALLQAEAQKNKEFASVLAEYRSAHQTFEAALAIALRDVAFKPALTVEYKHDTPANETPVSRFRLMTDKPFLPLVAGESALKTAQASLTLNAALTVYERIPVGLKAGRIRDVQAGLQFSRLLGPKEWEKRPTFSLAGYYQYMKENAILEFNNDQQTPFGGLPLPGPAVEVLNTKGGIGIVQAKVEIPLGNTGVVFPLAISWSNRTELIKARSVKGQFGIQYSFDGLFGSK